MIRAVALLLGSFIATTVAEHSKPNPPDGGTGRLRRFAEFVHVLHVTDYGQDYLYERVPDSRGFSHTRIQGLRARMYVPSDTILDLVRNEERPPELRALALRFLSPMDEEIDLRLVHDLLESNDPALRLETLRTLQGSPLSGAPELEYSTIDIPSTEHDRWSGADLQLLVDPQV